MLHRYNEQRLPAGHRIRRYAPLLGVAFVLVAWLAYWMATAATPACPREADPATLLETTAGPALGHGEFALEPVSELFGWGSGCCENMHAPVVPTPSSLPVPNGKVFSPLLASRPPLLVVASAAERAALRPFIYPPPARPLYLRTQRFLI